MKARVRAYSRPKILHLAYEDHAKPWAGGGSARTREINERLADRYEITVVCARYRGARARTENGVQYRFVGLPLGYFGDVLAYFFFLPYALFRYRSDLVIEEFGAPFSSIGVPYFTRRPVIGAVGWLFAEEKAKQYKLPFHWVQRFGLKSHRELIAVSADLADELRHRNPRGRVHVVPCGIDKAHVDFSSSPRSNILFMGRLDIAQKGLDILIEAYADIAPQVEQDLLIAGDGRDRVRLQKQSRQLGISERVRFLGWISARQRIQCVAAVDFVVMPSRYETFGMVAAEALSVSTPVVAFDVPCLRELVTAENGILVPDIDVGSFATAMLRLAKDSSLRQRLGNKGPQTVARLSWDSLAKIQGDIYAAILSSGESTRGGVSDGYSEDPHKCGASAFASRGQMRFSWSGRK